MTVQARVSLHPTVPGKLAKAKMFYHQGDYPESMRIAMAVYQKAVHAGDQPDIADAANLIGLITLARKQPNEAAVFFKKALQINRSLNNQQRIAANLLNISLAHAELNKLDSAVIYVKGAIELSTAQNLKDLVAMGKNHLGDYYFKEGRFASAVAEFRSVLEDKDHQSNWENSFASTGLAKIWFAKHRFDEAAKYADQGFYLALSTDAKWDASQALEIAHQAYYNSGDFQLAYQRLLTFKKYHDSLFNAGKDIELNQLQLKANAVENENLQNQIKISSQQQRIDRLILVIVFIILLLATAVSVRIYRSRRLMVLKNQQLSADYAATSIQRQHIELQNDVLNLINQDNKRLFSIIGHDLRGPFASIESTLLLFRSGDLSHEELQELSEKLAAQINTASGMLNSLLIWAANQMGGISFQPVEVDLNAKVEKVVGVSGPMANYKGIVINYERSLVSAVIGDADQIRIMIQNLVSNAIKFTPVNGSVSIGFVKSGSFLDLFVRDTGVGMSEEKLAQVLSGSHQASSTYGTNKEKGIGLGLHLVREFAIKNSIIFFGESRIGQGTTLTLRFQVSNP